MKEFEEQYKCYYQSDRCTGTVEEKETAKMFWRGALEHVLKRLSVIYDGAFENSEIEKDIREELEESLESVPHPICPMNMYFEGDEDKCDASKCDFEDRKCSQRCTREILEEIE